MEASKIWYMVNLRIKMSGATVVTGALVTCLKSFKIFLGFDWLQAVNLVIDWQQMMLYTPEGWGGACAEDARHRRAQAAGVEFLWK
jgi:hypothetical protein